MKKGYFTKMAILGAALIVPASAEKVKLEDLSPQLQERIRSQTGSARIEDIDRTTRDGKTTYEVAFKNSSGQHTELVFEDTTRAATTPPPLDSRKIDYQQLPVPVRRVADNHIKGGEVNDVERKVSNGQVTYEIGFKAASGGPQQAHRELENV